MTTLRSENTVGKNHVAGAWYKWKPWKENILPGDVIIKECSYFQMGP